jgi:hypothetical protein
MSLVEYKYDDSPQYNWASRQVTYRDSLSTSSSGTVGHYRAPVQTVDQFSDYDDYDFPDWDGYGAIPISKETVNAARRLFRLLPRAASDPDIAAAGDGTIGFEWRSDVTPDRTIIFIEVGPGEMVKASRFYSDRPAEIWSPKPIGMGVYSFISALFPPNDPA